MENKPPPEDLKFIAPFLDRGRELKQREPVVAYWCNYYAAKLALVRGAKSKDSQQYLGRLLDALEEEKKNLAGNEAITNDTVAYARVENFALKIFLLADNEDREGLASKKTAKTFLAASIFLEVLKTFGEVDAEVEEKIKYSKWKAMDIMKCLREGRKPIPGPPGGEQVPEQQYRAAGDETEAPASGYGQQQAISQTVHVGGEPVDIQNLPAAPTTPVVAPGQWQAPHSQQSTPPLAHSSLIGAPPDQHYSPLPHPQQRQQLQEPPPALTSLSHPYGGPPMAPAAPYSPQSRSFASASYVPPPRPPSAGYTPVATSSGMKYTQSSPPGCAALSVPPPVLDHVVVAAASKHARFVISALQYDDVKTAVENLRQALKLLEPYNTD